MSEQIQHLMREIGPLVDAIDAIEQVGEQNWAIGFDEATWLTVDYNEQTDKLTLAIDCGPSPEQNRIKLYETLLTYNYLWEETGGLRMALDEPGGRVVLIFDVAVHGLDSATFATVVENMVTKSRLWQQSIQGVGSESDPPSSETPMGIRV